MKVSRFFILLALLFCPCFSAASQSTSQLAASDCSAYAAFPDSLTCAAVHDCQTCSAAPDSPTCAAIHDCQTSSAAPDSPTCAVAPECRASASSESEVPAAPDYADTAQFWYMPGYNAGLRCAADIIYIYPTTGTEPYDADGELADYSDPRDSAERVPITLDMRVKRELYADSTFNFFSPYYRQMTMKVYNEGNFTDKADVPEDDVRRAFRYYMDHFNGGRPFILLGHSQGSQHIVALIKKELSREELGRMIAAYCIGWKITKPELDEYPDRLKPAKGETDTGCIVLFNSVTDPASQSSVLAGSYICINPLNWHIDSTLAPKELHMGFRRWRSSKGAYQVVEHYTGAYRKGGCLVCPDANPADIYIESLKDIFPWGNLHCMDSWLFSENIRDNMRLRAKVWLDAHASAAASAGR